jgi:hypothetical protein
MQVRAATPGGLRPIGSPRRPRRRTIGSPRDCSHAVWEALKQLVDPGEKYRTANDLMAEVA